MNDKNNSSDRSAIAFKVAAFLEAYQLQIERLAADWLNRPLYRTVTAQLDEIGSLLGAFPQLAVDMVEVVMCHMNLLNLLQAHGGRAEVSQLQSRQVDAIAAMRRKTLKLLCAPA